MNSLIKTRQNVTLVTLLMMTIVFYMAAYSQSEMLTNAKIIEMAKAGLSPDVILYKIQFSVERFDISSDALIELKRAGVDDSIVAAIVEISRSATSGTTPAPVSNAIQPTTTNLAKDSLLTARTIAIKKSSLNPSRQALEKELLKRADFRSFNLTIEQYKDAADLYIDIGHVPLSIFTHRYVYRIFDRRTGAVLAAGETTSWGSLAENLAKHISLSLIAIRN
jgi:hypothetical protein